MYSPASTAARAYAQVGIESDVIAASPHQLIVLLYQGAELSVRMAIRHIQDGELMKKSTAVTKAGSIIRDGLRAALDTGKGGELAGQLAALYDYMDQRIMLAHLQNDPAPLHEVLGLLRELREAWQAIGTSTRSTAPTFTHSVAA
ncbi:MAG: flagellar export chaperone FliS [Hydrogenophilales bacterium 16-64-46]|nr:MAG: flagellar export chaperone FliS [Hydrogenophilales bacterium 12-64-13]OYZ04113.1 MAG: flagellar export chaperone FliS [Hydrogenophilales bacterium 16-64-46]OZA36862.1 MAG: flagellar export chaperone FliS [Hydrogenophilales bacterium 17-64-34]HQT00024.1 flagellar export chaperone FliS [Thiobacillus sp.]